MHIMQASRYQSIIPVLIIFFLFSLAIYWAVPTHDSCLEIDSSGYDAVGLHFAQTGRLEDPYAPTKAPVQTVGYHAFVGFFFALFGHAYAPIIWFQIFLTMASLVVLWSIARLLFTPTVAQVTVVLAAFNLGFLVYPQFLLAESLVVFLLLLFMQRFVQLMLTSQTSYAWQAGLILGISIMVKPAGLLFSVLSTFLLLFLNTSWRKKITMLLLFIMSFSIPVTAYMMRNKLKYGVFHLAPMMSLNMYYVFLSKVIAQVDGSTIAQAEQKIPPFVGQNSLDEHGWAGARALFYEYTARYPWVCVQVWMKNVSKTVFGLYTTQLKILLEPCVKGGDVSFFALAGTKVERFCAYVTGGTSSIWLKMIAWYEVIYSLLRYVLMVIGLVVLIKRQRYLVASFFIIFIINGAFITGFDGCGRYRIIFEPVILLVAAYAAVTIVACIKERRYKKPL